MNNSSSAPVTGIVIFYATNTVSVLVCLLAILLVFALRLYKKVVYRLALYQVLSSLALASFEMLQFVFDNYSANPLVYDRACVALGWFTYYTQWTKLLFTGWVTLHVFCFGVFRKDLKRLEVLYVVTSLLVPMVIASVPVITHSYNLLQTTTNRRVCYVFDALASESNDALIERFALWDCPAMLILLAASVAMIIMVIRLAHIWLRSKADQYRKAIKQLLPLAIFPVLFFVFVIPGLAFDIRFATPAIPKIDMTLSMVTVLSTSLWSLASGLTLVLHISVARRCAKKRANTEDAAAKHTSRYDSVVSSM